MKIKLTESKLREIVSESIKRSINEITSNEYYNPYAAWQELTNKQEETLKVLLDKLKNMGVKSAHMHNFPSGAPCIAIDSDEYRKIVKFIPDNFRAQINPATTYIAPRH